MGVDYYYCGQCKEAMHEDEFPCCHNDDCERTCGEMYRHRSGHGYYCLNCGIDKNKFIEIDEMIFCDDKCHKRWKQIEDEYLIKREKEFVRCTTCNEEYLKYTTVAWGGGTHWCSFDCYENYNRYNGKECFYCKKIPSNLIHFVTDKNGDFYCDKECRKKHRMILTRGKNKQKIDDALNKI